MSGQDWFPMVVAAGGNACRMSEEGWRASDPRKPSPLPCPRGEPSS